MPQAVPPFTGGAACAIFPRPERAFPTLSMTPSPEADAVLATVVGVLPYGRVRLATPSGAVLAASLDPAGADLGMDIAPGMRVWVRPSRLDPTRGTVVAPATRSPSPIALEKP